MKFLFDVVHAPHPEQQYKYSNNTKKLPAYFSTMKRNLDVSNVDRVVSVIAVHKVV